jgi:hypothetical protein
MKEEAHRPRGDRTPIIGMDKPAGQASLLIRILILNGRIAGREGLTGRTYIMAGHAEEVARQCGSVVVV